MKDIRDIRISPKVTVEVLVQCPHCYYTEEEEEEEEGGVHVIRNYVKGEM